MNLQSTYYHFFRDSLTAMAIADKLGTLVASNDCFNTLMKSLSGINVDIKSNTARLGSSFDFLPIQDVVRFSNLLSKLANDGETKLDFKTPYRDKNGNVRWFKIHAWRINLDPRIDLSGRGPFIGFIMHDETMETEAEEKLHEDMRIAEKAMETKSRFLATMSHEIRTPIQTIIGTAELLEDTALNGEQKNFTRQIQLSAEVLLSLVNDILDYSKIEAGKMELDIIPFSPARAIEETVQMLLLEINKKGLEISLEISPGIDQVIMGDLGKFRQILINLIKNAVKFTPKGTITIKAATLGDEQLRNITVSVADTGIGIPEEFRERLFTTFMQADSSHTRRFGGSGLGLAISRNMVELMGGNIEMVPNEGGGSIFRFTIPAPEAEPGIIEETEKLPGTSQEIKAKDLETLPDTAIPKAAEPLLSSVKVMVVEDYPINRELFIMIMEKLGADVTSAEDGQEALEKARSDLDIIFMDIQMPRMNGYEAATELRKRGYTIPIIAITAGTLEEEQKLCLDAGFNDILFKPFKRPGIEMMYRKWLNTNTLNAGTPHAGTKEKEMEWSTDVFNAQDLVDTFMEDEERAKAMLKLFVERTVGQLESLPLLNEEKNWEEARRLAHTIKGASRTLSGLELGNAAARLEKAYKDLDMEEIKAAYAPVVEEYKRFKEATEQFLQS